MIKHKTIYYYSGAIFLVCLFFFPRTQAAGGDLHLEEVPLPVTPLLALNVVFVLNTQTDAQVKEDIQRSGFTDCFFNVVCDIRMALYSCPHYPGKHRCY